MAKIDKFYPLAVKTFNNKTFWLQSVSVEMSSQDLLFVLVFSTKKRPERLQNVREALKER